MKNNQTTTETKILERKVQEVLNKYIRAYNGISVPHLINPAAMIDLIKKEKKAAVKAYKKSHEEALAHSQKEIEK